MMSSLFSTGTSSRGTSLATRLATFMTRGCSPGCPFYLLRKDERGEKPLCSPPVDRSSNACDCQPRRNIADGKLDPQATQETTLLSRKTAVLGEIESGRTLEQLPSLSATCPRRVQQGHPAHPETAL